MLEPLFLADTMLFLYINKMFSHPILDQIIPLVSHLGSLFFWIPASIILLNYRRPLGKKLITGLIPSILIVFSVKHIVARPRPFEVLEGINVLDTETLAGFPSGHATFVFLAAYLLSKEFPKYKIHFYSLAMLVAFSRIYVGVHYPLDVLAGSIIGIGVGYSVVQLLPNKKSKSRTLHRSRGTLLKP